MSTPTAHLVAEGVSIWLDDLSRQRIITGNLADLIVTRNVSGVTTNPTIFAGAIGSGSDSYAGQIHELATHGASADEAIFAITTDDVRAAADVFRPVYDATDGVDGRVSIEVSPDLAHDTDATIAQAKELWATVDRPNVHIKIPATKAGLPAITEVIGSGISVNVTLIFSLERYAAVIDAYLAGIEQAQAAGLDVSTIHSVASFFVSRVDTEVDKRIAAIDTEDAADPQGPGRHRQRPSRVRAVREGVRHRPREGPDGCRRQRAAAAVGVDRREGPRSAGHPLRHRARRPRARSTRCPRRPSRRRSITASSPATPSPARTPGRTRCSTASPPPASTSPT